VVEARSNAGFIAICRPAVVVGSLHSTGFPDNPDCRDNYEHRDQCANHQIRPRAAGPTDHEGGDPDMIFSPFQVVPLIALCENWEYDIASRHWKVKRHDEDK